MICYTNGMKNYVVAKNPPENIAKELAAYPEIIQALLFNRGVISKKEADEFLNPDYERDVKDPFNILNMDKAATRILDAIRSSERIVVYGDYDCDGIPGSVVLHDLFNKIGNVNFTNYIPHRHKEGYGLNKDAIDKFSKDGSSLIITVDCGITDVEEVAHANSLNIDVIITDHHLPQEILPPAFAIVNSKQNEDTYHDDMLCGAAVAFKLSVAILNKGKFEHINKGWEKWLLDMVGVSTVADMVPLRKENRALAYFGLKVLSKSSRPGLLKLFRNSGISQKNISEDDIGFTIAPRLNSASRLGEPFDAFRLLSTKDEVEAGEIAKDLQKLNDERKKIVVSIKREIKKNLDKRELRAVVVIGNPKWKIGVVGLAASYIVEEFGKVAFVWGRDGESPMIKGSCRSNGSVNLVELMTAVPERVFENAGGHEFSGGFSIRHDKIHHLEDHLNTAYLKLDKKDISQEESIIDANLRIDDVTYSTLEKVSKCSPFGVSNPKPVFLLSNIEIDSARVFGKDKNHTEVFFKNLKGDKIKAISFFKQLDSFGSVKLEAGKSVDLIASLEDSYFGGRRELRLHVVDILPSGSV